MERSDSKIFSPQSDSDSDHSADERMAALVSRSMSQDRGFLYKVLGSGVAVPFLFAMSIILSLSPSLLGYYSPTSADWQDAHAAPLIYTYPISQDLLYPESSGIRPGSCKEDMYHLEVSFPRLVERSWYTRTTANISEADFYLVPHISTCYYHACVFHQDFHAAELDAMQNSSSVPRDPAECKRATAGYVSRIMDFVRHGPGMTAWNASLGTDHLMVFSWYARLSATWLILRDQASEVLGWASTEQLLVQPAIHLTLLGSIGPIGANFNPHKDIVVPPWATDYPTVLDSFSDDKLASGRDIFAYFRGTVIPDHRYSWGVRQYLLDLGRTHAHRYLVAEGHHAKGRMGYWGEMNRALFSLCPSGT